MDLIKAARSGSLQDVEEAVNAQGIWADYEALNIALANGKTDIAKFLLSQNCRVNKPNAADKFESSPLHKAVKLKDVDLVKLLLQNKASVTAVSEGGNTPLHLAFTEGLSEVVNVLIEFIGEGSEIVNCRNDFGLSHLQIACTTENSKVIQKYLETNGKIEDTVNEDSPKWAGYTAYRFAIEYKSLPAIYTLSNGKLCGQSMQKDRTGQTPQDLACERLVEYSIMTHIMQERKYDQKSYYFQSQSGVPKCRVVCQPTAFHLACMRNDSHLVEAFLKHGAPVNTPVSKEFRACPLFSPLHFAVESNRLENVKVLLEYGADLSQTNGYKMTPLHLAMYNEKCDWTKRVTDLLYSRVEDKEKNLTDNNQLSYFHIAAAKNDVKLVKKMLDSKQVDINSRVSANDRGFSLYTPFHFAVQWESWEMVELLADHGADVNAVCSKGTAFQMAYEMSDNYHTFEYACNWLELLVRVGVKADAIIGKETLLHKIVHTVIQDIKHNMNPTTVMQTNPGESLDYIARVIELGCDVNAKDENGNTALHMASIWSIACVKRLLQAGADVNIENNRGQCVNLFHTSGIGRRKPEDSVVCHHVQNLKALGWKINPKLDKECDELLKEWAQKASEDDTDEDDNENKRCNAYDSDGWESPPVDYFEPYDYDDDKGMYNVMCIEHWIFLTQEDRPNEIKKMKKVKLDKQTTLYDFMRLEGESLGVFANNEVLKNIVEGLPDSPKFSVYGYLIKLQYRKSQKYAEAKVTRKTSSSRKDGEKVLRKRKRVE